MKERSSGCTVRSTQNRPTIPDGAMPVQNNGGDYILSSNGVTVTSIALDQGWYILEEIQAPTGYAIIGDGLTSVQVIANETNSNIYVIENDALVPLVINKTGTILSGSGGVVTTEQLAGAVFAIYDSETSRRPSPC